MNTPVLTIEEQHNIDAGPWFSKLSPVLRQEILDRSTVRRLADGASLASRGAAAQEWCGVARGAVRISTISLSGKQVTLTYAEPGTWFGDIALFDGLPRTHDADAHGPTTLLVVRRPEFRELLARHVELYDALLRLNCRRLRLMFDHFEDLNTRPLRSRLARQLLLLARSYGVEEAGELRIGLALAPASQSGVESPRTRRRAAGGADPAGHPGARKAARMRAALKPEPQPSLPGRSRRY
jgi:CRP-like cAMP-binding protein